MSKIQLYCENYETLCVNEKPTSDAVIEIYKELIDLGMLPSEIQNKKLVKEFIKGVYDYYVDIYMDFLSYELQFVASVDIIYDNGDTNEIALIEEEEIDGIEIDEYVISVVSIDLTDDEVSQTVANVAFSSLDEIREYSEKVRSSYDIINKYDGDLVRTEMTELMAVEDLKDELIRVYGISGEVIADQIETEAFSVVAYITIDNSTDLVKEADLHFVYGVNRY